MMVIPKSSNAKHVRENHAALDIHLSKSDLAELDYAFPEPKGPRPLELL
jgi:diketogulonate reductase-like aldo/keto reductase